MCIVDPLNDLTSQAHRGASLARRAFLEERPEDCKAYLQALWCFLTDELAGEAPSKEMSTDT